MSGRVGDPHALHRQIQTVKQNTPKEVFIVFKWRLRSKNKHRWRLLCSCRKKRHQPQKDMAVHGEKFACFFS